MFTAQECETIFYFDTFFFVVSDANHKGSSNSQDSFPPPGSSSTSMDSYVAYPAGYPPNSGQNYNENMQRSPSQTNQQPPTGKIRYNLRE